MGTATIETLKALQAEPLERKVLITQTRIIEWFQHWDGNVFVSFSGGKDSTVLLHIVRELFPDVPAVFFNTGLEYPEVVKFAQSFENVESLRPRVGRASKTYGKDPDDIVSFVDAVRVKGYPLITKAVSDCIREARKKGHESARWKRLTGTYINPKTGELDSGSQFNQTKYLPLYYAPFRISDECCKVFKKGPSHNYQRQSKKKIILATTTEESILRRQSWLQNGGCNAFNADIPLSAPMSFWKEQDILRYIVKNRIPICSVYGDIVAVDKDGYQYDPNNPMLPSDLKLKCTGCERTGCMFCAFGSHLEKGESRFQRLKRTHPKQYGFCMGGGEWVDNPDYDPTKGKDEWNPKQIWVPNKNGLGMAKVFDMVNEIYGKDFLRYE